MDILLIKAKRFRQLSIIKYLRRSKRLKWNHLRFHSLFLSQTLRLADATAVSRARSPPGRYRPCNLCSRYISTGGERTAHLHCETRYMEYSSSMYNYARLVPGADVLFLIVHYAIAAAVEKAVRVGGYNPYVREYRAISWARQGNARFGVTLAISYGAEHGRREHNERQSDDSD